MKKIIRKILPDSVVLYIIEMKTQIELLKNVRRDYKRFKKYSFKSVNPVTQDQFSAMITKSYHSIEKGLSYKDIRLGFGKYQLSLLMNLLNQYFSKGFDKNLQSVVTAVHVIDEYIKLHESMNYDVSQLKTDYLATCNGILANKNLGGSISLKKEDILGTIHSDFESFSKTRYSIRDFAEEHVDIELVRKAINIAKKTPSACNRQAWQVKIVRDSDIIKAVLLNQNGNRGFGQGIDTLLLVTCNLSSFALPRENNQAYIDGGLYSMSLLYALHYVGLASCSLSAALTDKQELNVRKILSIEENEELIMFIAVGNYIEEFNVPKSNRYDSTGYSSIY